MKKTFAEIFDFYRTQIKPLHATNSAGNKLPEEYCFEIVAAFDHLSRHWYTEENTEEKVADETYRHLCRACFDLFKIYLRDTIDIYEKELRSVDTSIIDNGQFDASLHVLVAEIKQFAAKAREAEGVNHDKAIELWQESFGKCVALRGEQFFLNPKVSWAKKITKKRKWKERIIEWIGAGVLGGFIGWLISKIL